MVASDDAMTLLAQAGHYVDNGSGLSGTESCPGSAEKGKAPVEALLRAENLRRKCVKVHCLLYPWLKLCR